MKQPQIEITADGSATLYIPEIDEHYHSVKGALTESLHTNRIPLLKSRSFNNFRSRVRNRAKRFSHITRE